MIICLYVDDMLIFSTHINAINETKMFLSSQFYMKDLGEAYVILGVKVTKIENGFIFVFITLCGKVIEEV